MKDKKKNKAKKSFLLGTLSCSDGAADMLTGDSDIGIVDVELGENGTDAGE
jgi:hypothetical protein